MQNDSGECEDSNILQFISELRQEALYISSEKSLIQELNGKVQNKTDELSQSTWVTNKKRLSLLPQREFTPQNIQGILSLSCTEFVEAKTVVGFQNAGKLGKVLQIIRTQPEHLAQWLIIGEQLNDEQTHLNLLQSIVCGLYASLIFPEDIKYMLILLHELSKYQLFRNEKPQRAIKQRANSFESLYYIFHEILSSARYFLSGALEVPILRLLTIDYYLDVDPEKSLMRFHQEEKISSLFKNPVEYRNEVIRKLAEITNLFVLGLKENSLSFPKPLSWLVYQISFAILESFDDKEANAVLTELIFSMFICPAIVNPLQYGICDAQITALSRHNLMQVGQIIQSLALIKYEFPDSKVKDLYDLINKDNVVYFMDEIFTQWKLDNTPPVDFAPFIFRETAFFTELEIRNLVDFLQKVHGEIVQNKIHEGKPVLADSLLEQISVLGLDTMEQPMGKQEKLYNGQNDNNFKKPSSLFSLVARPTNSKLLGEVQILNNVVLIFPIKTDNIEPVGMLSEGAIIKKNKDNPDLYTRPNKISMKRVENNEDTKNYAYQDEGNTSDNLEAISEGASNHSVSSSLELENEDQNDNYSDMLSANVSGRGSPNISGRDTPSSQVNENEDGASSGVRQSDNAQSQQSSQALSRQIRSEIDDKFCKFEIKLPGPGRDETTSLVSETWSTDVLGSDNETIDAGDSRNDQQCYSLIDQPIREIPIGNLLDTSETQSESAWSTDVMASDTERLTEIDNDDTGSIAQSDDTNSIAPSDDTRSETDENLLPGSRRLSSSSNSFINQSNLASNYQEIRRLESRIEQNKIRDKNRRDSNANVIIKSLSYSIAQNSYSETKTQSSSSFVSKNQKTVNGMEKVETNGAHASSSNELSFMKQNRKYDERTNEILLSNSSLNSSSSGSSSNSLENKTQNEISEKWESKFHSSQSSLNVTSTPSESTSELSVLSVTNLISPVNMLKKPGVSNSRNVKTSNPSTGAIPKSISFDISADKGDKYAEDDYRSKRASFFGKLRMGFRNKRGKSFRHSDDSKTENDNGYSFNNSNMNSHSNQMKLNNDLDCSDQILEKYRTKPFEQSPKMNKETPKMSRVRNMSESTVVSNQSGNCFKNIKNKLRMVLSYSTVQLPGDIKTSKISIQDKIETILRIELGKARKLRQWSNVARISETLKCIQLLNEKHCKKLVKSMKNDILKRALYLQYLNSSRKDLLLSVAFLDGLQEQIYHEREQCEEYLATLFVDDFVRRKEAEMNNFCDEFKQLNLSDEKCDILDNFYIALYSDMKKDIVWNEIFKERKGTIKMTLQRYIISRVYENALYPNGDGDRDRDRVLYEHIGRLSNIITPDHKYLLIQKLFLRECPWLSAQEALKAMSAYRTPRDKVNCVINCSKCIMDLLSMAQNGSTTADDFTPVLVFVIIRSNPINLLSTIQFVNSFYQDQLCGEEQYWWIQFCAAVEFIKTMDYSE